MIRQLRLIPGGLLVGLAAGSASAGFLAALDAVTRWREAHPAVVWLLPAVGVVLAAAYASVGGRAVHGNRLTMAEIIDLREGVPLRMAPLVLIGTLGTHAFGGSAGREGTALQMAAGLTDGVSRRAGVSPADRRALLVAALAGGFGSVFGVPWAGLVFALEVSPARWRDRLAALPASIGAAWIGDRTVGWWGVHHHRYPAMPWVGPLTLTKVALCGLAFGLVAWAFVRGTDGLRALGRRYVPWPAARAGLGGVAVLGLLAAVGDRAYLGLSLPLLDLATTGVRVAAFAFALKLVFTAVTVGSGFQGGEVTPLFVVGACLGSTLARVVRGPAGVLAEVGMVATFAAAANAPLACTVMGAELFGWRSVPPVGLACIVARLVSTDRHLYEPLDRPVTPAEG